MIVDAWSNVMPARFAARWTQQSENASVEDWFGDQMRQGSDADQLLAAMDDAGVDATIVTSGLQHRDEEADVPTCEGLLDEAERRPGRLWVSATVDRAGKPTSNVRRIRELAEHPSLVLVRVTPLVEQYPLNHRLYYPVYATCEELGLPVSINVGVPGPRVRSGCQDPRLLEDVLIDFPRLTVVGAHMGHPYEELLITYMRKWPRLYLMNSAYLAKYFEDALVRFMNSSTGRGRVLFASDHPVIPMQRALDEARALPLDDEAMELFLGESARQVLLESRAADPATAAG